MNVDMALPFGPESEVLDPELKSVQMPNGMWMTTDSNACERCDCPSGIGATKQESIHDYYLEIDAL